MKDFKQENEKSNFDAYIKGMNYRYFIEPHIDMSNLYIGKSEWNKPSNKRTWFHYILC